MKCSPDDRTTYQPTLFGSKVENSIVFIRSLLMENKREWDKTSFTNSLKKKKHLFSCIRLVYIFCRKKRRKNVKFMISLTSNILRVPYTGNALSAFLNGNKREKKNKFWFCKKKKKKMLHKPIERTAERSNKTWK